MPIEFVYQVVKDLIALAKMEEADPIDPGTLDAHECPRIVYYGDY